jgi:hypothetical protein
MAAPQPIAVSAPAMPPRTISAPAAAPGSRSESAPAPASAAIAEALATATLEQAPENDTTHAAAWQATLEAVNAKKRMLGAFLVSCHFVGLSDGHAVLAMDDLHRAVVDEKENRSIIAAALAQCFGRPVGVRCVAPVAGASAAPADADVKPMIDRAIAWFEGDVIEPKRPERNEG